MTHQLIDFLVGEKDGVPKDPNYIYRLYLALKKYDDAAKTALIIARQEQDLGNYALAHSVVVETIRHLEDAGMKVSLQLRQSFVLLHSYLLIKSLIKRGDHNTAARLLLRVIQSVSKFPLHVVPLLTTTVVECQRAGLKDSAYEYATALMRPEYRPLIDAGLKRKIEAIVRRRVTPEEKNNEELTTLCPVSGQLIPATQLECPTTRDALPMCVVTGRHMELNDWCFCPISKCPALYSEYVKYIESESGAGASDTLTVASATAGTSDNISATTSPGSNLSPKNRQHQLNKSLSAPDPVLGKSVSINELILSTPEEAMSYIQRYNNVIEKKESKKREDDEDGGDENTPQEGGRNRNNNGDGGENGTISGNNSPEKQGGGGEGSGGGGRKGGDSNNGGGGQRASKGKIDRARRMKHRKGGH